MAAASGRVTISLAPPGGNALMMVIACEGKASCANTGAAASALAADPMRKRRRSLRCPFEAGPPDDISASIPAAAVVLEGGLGAGSPLPSKTPDLHPLP